MSSGAQEHLQRPFRRYLSKTPELTVLFWVVKILVTPVSDAFVDSATGLVGLGVTTMLVITLLACLMVARLSISRYIAWLYWLIVVLISIFGTLLADNVIDIFGVSPTAATAAFGVLLLGAFAVWQLVERTLSIHTIDTARRDAFYWLAVLFTFALGGAAGDAGFETLGIGYGPAAATFAALVGAVWMAHRFLRLRPVPAFWIAYVVTYALGASAGDFLSRPVSSGGLGLGTAVTSVVFLVVICLAVAHLTVSRRDDPSLDAATRQAREAPPW